MLGLAALASFSLLWQIGVEVKGVRMSDDEKKVRAGAEHIPTAGSANNTFAYSIRKSKKAKRISLRVLQGAGLEVVLPFWADESMVPDVLGRHAAWIRRNLDKMREAPCPEAAPESIALRGGAELVELRLSDAPSPAFPVRERNPDPSTGRRATPPRGIPKPEPLRSVLHIPRTEPDKLYASLKEWVRAEARVRLGGRLEELAGLYGFTFTSVSIRFQKSRWGSCSAKGGISLNAALIFLPDALADYILLHELCHTRQMNHSEKFWKLLFSIDPDALAKDRAMRRAWRYVPAWLHGLSQ